MSWAGYGCALPVERSLRGFPSAGRRGENELRVAVAGILPLYQLFQPEIFALIPNEYWGFTVISVGTDGVNEVAGILPLLGPGLYG